MPGVPPCAPGISSFVPDLSRAVVRRPTLVLAPAQDGYLAFDTGSRRLYRLNSTAALVLDLCDSTRSPSAILAVLAPLLANADVDASLAWITEGLRDGLLDFADALPVTAPTAGELTSVARKLRSDGEVLSAFVCQDAAVRLEPDDASAWSSLGELAHIVGRRARAREAYEEYLSRSPGDAEVEQILIALRDAVPPLRAPDRCIEQLYARFAAHYDANMCDDLDYQAPLRLREALDACPGLSAAPDVLELGCGTGLAAKCLRPRARTLVGIDLSPQMIEKARSTGAYDELQRAEITQWLCEDTRDFDLIAASDTLIYFGDLRLVLEPARRRLRVGGVIAFTVERGPASGFVLTDSGRYAHSAEHVREAATEAGLVVVSLTEGFLRNEYGEAVTGLVVVLRCVTVSGGEVEAASV
jgi:predicted TPR repeat methyltransferase